MFKKNYFPNQNRAAARVAAKHATQAAGGGNLFVIVLMMVLIPICCVLAAAPLGAAMRPAPNTQPADQVSSSADVSPTPAPFNNAPEQQDSAEQCVVGDWQDQIRSTAPLPVDENLGETVDAVGKAMVREHCVIAKFDPAIELTNAFYLTDSSGDRWLCYYTEGQWWFVYSPTS